MSFFKKHEAIITLVSNMILTILLLIDILVKV